jgi:MerR family transcriptional regulator/heat shock protein HspR
MSFFDDDIREKFHNLTGLKNADSDWEPVISIGTAAKSVDLSVSALRKYEKEGLLLYHRTESGHRLLSRADMARIRMIQYLITQLGLNMEGIRRLLALLPCWRLKPCTDEEKRNCPVVQDPVRPCWMVNRNHCERRGIDCRQCNVYRYGAYCTVVMKSLLYDMNNRKEN